MDQYAVRGPDERFHSFKREEGGWKHYSRSPGDSFSKLEDNGRLYNLQEVRDAIDTLRGFGPISEDEIKWIKLHARQGQIHDGVDWSQETNEIEADPNRKVGKFQCEKCLLWFPQDEKRRFTWETFPAEMGRCVACHDKRIKGMGYHPGA